VVVFILARCVLKGDRGDLMTNINNNLISDEMSDRIIESANRLVAAEGPHNITVRMILQDLDITNRVFYNRFHNINEVLEILSYNTVMKVRESLRFKFDEKRDFFEQIMEVVERTLILSYETRMKFAHYVFENDTTTNDNYEWWTREIKIILDYAIEKNYIKDIDIDMASYAIWCFIRGFNADAIGRNVPLDEALKKYRYGFSFILEGLRKN